MKISNNRANKFGAEKTAKVWKKTNGKCFYCGRHLQHPSSSTDPNQPNLFTMDHFLPTSRGGTTDISNLVPSCRICNGKKANSTVDFLRFKMLSEKHGWTKFNQIQYEFLFKRGVNLGLLLGRWEFYFEKIHLK